MREKETLEKSALECVHVLTDGKGAERHATTDSIWDQPWYWIERNIHSFALAQAVKKIHESQRFGTKERQVRELQGAVGYLLLKIQELQP